MASWDPCHCFPSTGSSGRLPVFVGSDLNFGRDAYAARALLTKPSPQPSLADDKLHASI